MRASIIAAANVEMGTSSGGGGGVAAFLRHAVDGSHQSNKMGSDRTRCIMNGSFNLLDDHHLTIPASRSQSVDVINR